MVPRFVGYVGLAEMPSLHRCSDVTLKRCEDAVSSDRQMV